MRLFFWDFDDVNDISRQWTMFIINLLAVAFTSYCLFKTAKYHGKIMFQLLPLSVNFIATVLLLFIKLFEKGYEFGYVGYVIQIFTYFLFSYTFALLHAKTLKKQTSTLKNICNGLLLGLAIATVTSIGLILTSVIGTDCEDNLVQISIVGLATQFISYVPTAYFGMIMLKSLKEKDKKEQRQSRKSFTEEISFEPISDQYMNERKKQISLVLSAYTLSLLLRGLVLIFNIDWSSYFVCTQCDGIYILTSDQFWGQFLLVLIEINQLIPHLIIPIAMFVIPVGKLRQNNKIDLQETLIDDEDLSDASDIVQRRITKSILNRSSPSKEDLDDN